MAVVLVSWLISVYKSRSHLGFGLGVRSNKNTLAAIIFIWILGSL